MPPAQREIRTWQDVSPERFRVEILPLKQPAVLKGLVSDWPAVRHGKASPQELCGYLGRFDMGRPVGVLSAAPQVDGRFFYRDDMRGFNFERHKLALGEALSRLLAEMDAQSPRATYIESALIADCLQDFARDNVLGLADPSAVARIWIGNRLRTQTHYDLYDNIACVIAGRRRFTLFAPEQLENLYMGPFEFTLSGTPVSMASVEEPDFARFPRFEKAMAAALTAELEPGDAIYIPYFWWHHVQSLDRFNGLVSYWWNQTPGDFGSLYNCLLHGILAIRDLPDDQRMAWRAMFDHFVFKTAGEPMAHVPPHARGALGPMSPQQRAFMKQVLLDGVQKAASPAAKGPTAVRAPGTGKI